MIEGHIFLDAYFVNDGYDVVETLWYSKEEDTIRPYTLVAEEGDKQWEKFLKTPIDDNGRCVTIDDLMERTYIRNKELVKTRDQVILQAMSIKDEFISETLITHKATGLKKIVKTKRAI